MDVEKEGTPGSGVEGGGAPQSRRVPVAEDPSPLAAWLRWQIFFPPSMLCEDGALVLVAKRQLEELLNGKKGKIWTLTRVYIVYI